MVGWIQGLTRPTDDDPAGAVPTTRTTTDHTDGCQYDFFYHDGPFEDNPGTTGVTRSGCGIDH